MDDTPLTNPNTRAVNCRPDARAGLRELLELLHNADRLIGSFEGEFRDWVDPTPSNVLVADRGAVLDGRLRLTQTGAGLFPSRREVLRRIWFEAPQRLRVELVRGGQVARFGVRDGAVWSRWDREQGISSAGGDGVAEQSRPLPPLLDPALLSPARLIGLYRFELVREATRLGRRVLVARAAQRAPTPGGGALSYEFEFDAERGAMLRRAVFEDVRCVQLTEALRARFGAAIDQERFMFQLP